MNSFQNAVCKTVAISFKPRCVKWKISKLPFDVIIRGLKSNLASGLALNRRQLHFLNYWWPVSQGQGEYNGIFAGLNNVTLLNYTDAEWPERWFPYRKCRFGGGRAVKSKRTRGAIITTFLRQNNVATSFWRNNDVIITFCAHLDGDCQHLSVD